MADRSDAEVGSMEAYRSPSGQLKESPKQSVARLSDGPSSWSVAEVLGGAWADLKRTSGPAVLALGIMPVLWRVPLDYWVPADLMSQILYAAWLWPLVLGCGEISNAVEVAKGGRISWGRFRTALRYLPAVALYGGGPVVTGTAYALGGVHGLVELDRVVLAVCIGALALTAGVVVFLLQLAPYALVGSDAGAWQVANFSVRHVARNWSATLGLLVTERFLYVPTVIVFSVGLGDLSDELTMAAGVGLLLVLSPLQALFRLAWARAFLTCASPPEVEKQVSRSG